MRGTIQKIDQEEQRRCDRRLPTAWRSEAPAARPPQPPGPCLRAGEVTVAPLGADEAALVTLGAHHGEARGAVAALAASGARVYVLAQAPKDKAEAAPAIPEGQLLARRTPSALMTSIYTPREAWVWIGGGVALRLDDKQAAALRHLFLRGFWYEATEERFEQTASAKWQAPLARPFDVPEVPPEALARWADAGDDLRADAAPDVTLHLASGAPPAATVKALWLPAGPAWHKELARLHAAGAEIRWEERDLPDLLLREGGGELLMTGARRLRLRLNGQQADALGALLGARASWRFQVDVDIQAPALRGASFWLPDARAAQPLAQEQTIDLPTLQAAALQEMSGVRPLSWPDPQPLALAVRYRWAVEPPRAPTKTEPDPLLGQWERLDKDWAASIDQLKGALDDIQQHQGSLRKSFARLVSAVLGFSTKHTRLCGELRALESMTPSACGPQRARDALQKLQALREQVAELSAGQEEAEKKAIEDEERERQEAAWRQDRQEAQARLPERLAQRQEAAQKLTAAQTSLERAQRALDELKALSAARAAEAAESAPPRPLTATTRRTRRASTRRIRRPRRPPATSPPRRRSAAPTPRSRRSVTLTRSRARSATSSASTARLRR
jgi:hypothetical protein